VIIAFAYPTSFVTGTALPDHLPGRRILFGWSYKLHTNTYRRHRCLSSGEHKATLTARDAAGNESEFVFTVTAVSPPPVVQLFAAGSSIPASSGVGSGSKWKVLGASSVNDLGQVAFDATFTTPTGSGIFACSPKTLQPACVLLLCQASLHPESPRSFTRVCLMSRCLIPTTQGIAYLARLDNAKLALGELPTVFTEQRRGPRLRSGWDRPKQSGPCRSRG